jgi:hypothetical protein
VSTVHGGQVAEGTLPLGALEATNAPTTGQVPAASADGRAVTWTTPSSGSIPAGVIVMWSGTIASIPSGWALCNGSGGTPDLRSKFIKGAAAGVDPGGTGGSATHSHAAGTLADTAASAGTPAGTVSQPTFTGSALGTHQHGTSAVSTSTTSAGTPSGTVGAIAATGTAPKVTSIAGGGHNLADNAHTHPAPTFTGSAMSGHSHTVSGNVDAASAGTPVGTVSQPTFTGSAMGNHSHGVTGSTATASSEPEYYALAFIMKT